MRGSILFRGNQQIISHYLNATRMFPILKVCFEPPLVTARFGAGDNMRIGRSSYTMRQNRISSMIATIILRISLDMIYGRVIAAGETFQIALNAVNRKRSKFIFNIDNFIRTIRSSFYHVNGFQRNLINLVAASQKRCINCSSLCRTSNCQYSVGAVTISCMLARVVTKPPIISKQGAPLSNNNIRKCNT